jgi:excisionase family DNA binding protein
MGFGLAQQLMNQPGGLLGPQTTPSAAAPAPAAPPPVAPPVIALLSPAEVAQALNVSEADVLTELTAGTLKGRKIGSAWRVSRAALEDFLRG